MAQKRTSTSRRPPASKAASAAKSAKRRPPPAKGKQASSKVARQSPRKVPRKVVAKKVVKPIRPIRPIRPIANPAKVQHIAPGSVVKVVEGALDEMKAVQVKVLDVRKLTDIADTLIIASGNSDRHVRSISERVVEHAKKAGFRPMGVEGQRDGEWVLVDLQDVIVHIMLPRVRELYRLESLWDVSAARRNLAVGQ